MEDGDDGEEEVEADGVEDCFKHGLQSLWHLQ